MTFTRKFIGTDTNCVTNFHMQLFPALFLKCILNEPYPVNYDNIPPHEPAYEFLCFAPLVPAVCLDSQDEPHIHIGLRLQPSGENESSQCFYLDDTSGEGPFALRNGDPCRRQPDTGLCRSPACFQP